MANTYTKPDIADTGIYPIVARIVLDELHTNLKDMITGSSAPEGPNNIVVVGPGSEVLPYSDDHDFMRQITQGGNIILMDYNPSICKSIEDYLKLRGPKDFSVVRDDDAVLKGRVQTVVVQEKDICDGFFLPDSSVDCIDMTLCAHHATKYRSDVLDICREAYRVLRPGGVLHLGEGDVNMTRSESKILGIVNDLQKIGYGTVKVTDVRSGNVELEFPSQIDNDVDVIVNDKGRISIVGCAEEADYFRSCCYVDIQKTDCCLSLPIIDHAMPEDRQHIENVWKFYDSIRKDTLPGLDQDLHSEYLTAINKEQQDALQGVVEYYRPPNEWQRSLGIAGFEIKNIRYTKIGPFVNTLAVKPT